jgi:hypothetical protein
MLHQALFLKIVTHYYFSLLAYLVCPYYSMALLCSGTTRKMCLDLNSVSRLAMLMAAFIDVAAASIYHRI